MARLVYALTRHGNWDLHRAGCADVTRAVAKRSYADAPTEFDASSEAEARRVACDAECQELGYDPDLDVRVFPCVLAALTEG